MTKLGENIKVLRNAYGESLQDLANVMNCAKSTIANYESGIRAPDLQTLQKIAVHYGYPLDELIRADFSELDIKGNPLTWDKVTDMYDTVFPMVSSEKAMEDTLFAKGYNTAKEIMTKIKKRGENVTSSHLVIAFDAYVESIDGLGTIESAANTVGLLILWWTMLPDEYTEKIGNALSRSSVSPARLLKMNSASENNAGADEENKRQFMLEATKVITECIKLLKESSEYANLADYYIALRYLIGMVDTGYGRDMNKTIGNEMMLTYMTLGNPYAFEYVEKSLAM